MTTTDPISALVLMAQRADVPTCVPCLLADPGAPADCFAGPDRDLTDLHADGLDLTPEAAAIYDLVLAEARRERWVVGTPDHGTWLDRLLYGCRLALQMLPDVRGDVFGRFRLDLHDDVLPPRVEDLEWDVHRTVTALQAHVAETDAGEWVSPLALSGALADVHDAVRLLVLWHELWGEPTGASHEGATAWTSDFRRPLTVARWYEPR